MDFESYMSAIPEYNNVRPYQQIPFQFSLYYKENMKAEAVPFSFLAEPEGDPRLQFIENLVKQTQRSGAIIVFNEGFEKSRINELARDFPEFAEELSNIHSRIIDLMVPFRDKAYYKPEMQSSYSMKYVLPAIDPNYTYDNLIIQDGTQAGSEFLRLSTITDKSQTAQIRKDLIDYCNRDTYGMVIILEELEKLT